MSDTKKSEAGGTLRLKAPRHIVLRKTVEDGSIKQSFSHGRSKNVVVERRRKKLFRSGEEGDKEGTDEKGWTPSPAKSSLAATVEKRPSDDASRPKRQQILKPMTESERKSYIAEQKRLVKEEAAQRKAELEAKKKAMAAAKVAEKAAAKRAKEEAEQALQAAEKTEEPQPQKPEVVAEEKPVEAGSAPIPTEVEAQEATVESEPVEAALATEVSEAKPDVETEATPKTDAPSEALEAEKVAVVAPEEAVEEVVEEASADAVDTVAVEVEMEAVKESAPPKEPKKKLTKSQREEVARSKTEALVAKRLSQLEELREQKRLMEEKTAAQGVVEGQPRKTLKTRVKRKGKNAVSQQDDTNKQPQQKRRGRSGRGRGRQPEVQVAPPAPVVRDVIIPEVITVSELAARMAVKASEVIKLLFTQGMMVTINEVLDQDTAVLIVEELGHRPKSISEAATIDAELAETEDKVKELTTRSPVVTVMGHVDHGKTSLLDAIRKTDVTSREFGGITQHIGAYQVKMEGGASITFIDTPGHAAFTSMRSRGAKMTDIVILVVAADDGVMPQTIEAIHHSKAAGVPIVVAVNKMDVPAANPDRIMQQLSEHELVPEDWGGDTIFCKLSAKTGEGIAELEELLLLQAEMLNLQVNATKKARGAIVEAKLDKGRGSVATCLVQSGLLKVGDIFVVGLEWGKIRGLVNDRGESVEEAGPSTPVEIIGLSGVPAAGDELITVPDERRAREIAAYRQRTLKEKERAKTSPSSMDDIFSQIKEGDLEEVNVVIKGDVRGSVEAVAEALEKIVHDEIRVKVIHTGVGGINESDVMLSMASGALVLGFNVRADAQARELAKREKISLSFYTVIYDLIDDITKAMEGKLNPKERETQLGHAEVREVFRITKVGNVAGCMVTDGRLTNKSRLRVFRDDVVIYDGQISALRRYKDDVKEVREGMECGISVDKYNDLKSGDVIEAYSVEEVRQTIG
ncbi:MAG: translation initiation factor IF-2 [Magnetococcales bacterium]|nr:translation initiation factor IF-2 [Magnetococcales bacterium]